MGERTGNQIGVLAESSLHAALKLRIAQAGDQMEVEVDGFVIDLVRGQQLFEIQTGNFSALRPKLRRLLPVHTVRVIYPVAFEKWIVREDEAGRFLGRRKSPKRGSLIEIFRELVRIPNELLNPNFELQVLATQQEEIWRDDGQGSWRRKHWSIADRRLLQVVDQSLFRTPQDYLSLLPDDLPPPFTNRELAAAAHCRLALAQKMTYTLREMGLLAVVGKAGNAHLYQVTPPAGMDVAT